ncbi:MAG: glyoxylase-like metal-dependent hydrolase (beta-lactamase superfamily II) [Halioglobus sp.]|jgi:glyoxylase-like metal-dependent hydrolase (beta-lactamase superfamily II)
MTQNRGLFTLEGAQAYLAAEPEMTTEQLSDRLFTVTDGQVRTIFLAGETSVIAFDTFGTPGKARAYAKAISVAVPDKPIATIVYSHDHLDHAGFAADLAPDAEIIADELCAKVVKLRNAEGQLQPTRVLVGKRNELEIDGVSLVLLNPGPTHGSGNLAAYFAEEKTFFSSDTILANAKYGFMPDYHFCNFIRFMRSFLELDWNRFVPGRYEMTDRAGFEHGCDFIEATMNECQQAFVGFVPIWAYEPMKGYCMGQLGDRFGHLEGFEGHIGQMAIRIVHHYLMGGWGLEDTPEPAVLMEDQVVL